MLEYTHVVTLRSEWSWGRNNYFMLRKILYLWTWAVKEIVGYTSNLSYLPVWDGGDCGFSLLRIITSNITFLLIIVEFHLMYTDHTDFSLLQGLPPHLCNCPYMHQFVLPIYALDHGHTTCGQPLKENWVLPHSHPNQKQSFVESYNSESLPQFIRVLFNRFLSGLFL